jgi:O-antigen/teichoic acid export membrane protein
MAQILHQSYAALITYRRDFLFSALVELLGLAALLTAFFIWEANLNVEFLVQAFTLSVVGKAILLLWRYRKITWGRSMGENNLIQPRYFVLAFPFFLLGLSGMLNSRVDLYAVNYFLTAQDVGQYQVFTTFLLYLQAVAGFIVIPFVTTIYRLQQATIHKLSLGMMLIGILIIPPGLLVLSGLLRGLYGIELSYPFFIFGGLATLPIYFNSPIIYGMFKADRQMIVLWVNITAVLLNLLLNFLLLPRWGLIGAIIATAIVKWLSLAMYAIQSVSLRRKGVMI